MTSEVRNYIDAEATTSRRFNKYHILSTIGRLTLVPNMFVVIGGANLVLRDIKSTTPDIDMLVSQRGLEYLHDTLGFSYTSPPEEAIMRGATNTSVHLEEQDMVPTTAFTYVSGDGYYHMEFAQVRRTADMILGVPLAAMDEVIASKQALARPNDIDDLRRIALSTAQSIDIPKPRPGAGAQY